MLLCNQQNLETIKAKEGKIKDTHTNCNRSDISIKRWYFAPLNTMGKIFQLDFKDMEVRRLSENASLPKSVDKLQQIDCGEVLFQVPTAKALLLYLIASLLWLLLKIFYFSYSLA